VEGGDAELKEPEGDESPTAFLYAMPDNLTASRGGLAYPATGQSSRNIHPVHG
jgi:hypothetical protein